MNCERKKILEKSRRWRKFYEIFVILPFQTPQTNEVLSLSINCFSLPNCVFYIFLSDNSFFLIIDRQTPHKIINSSSRRLHA